MTVRQSELRALAESAQRVQKVELAEAANILNRPVVFISHSHTDRELIKGIKAKIKAIGWNVYIDWQDSNMPRVTDGATATTIKKRIRDAKHFLFVATAASMASRWCPWELGYADAAKGLQSIFVLPTIDDAGSFHGNEYLQVYQSISDLQNDDRWGVFQPGMTKTTRLLEDVA